MFLLKMVLCSISAAFKFNIPLSAEAAHPCNCTPEISIGAYSTLNKFGTTIVIASYEFRHFPSSLKGRCENHRKTWN